MRTLLVIVLVLAGTAATVRIDGIWPPAPVRQHLEAAVQTVIEPGKSLMAVLERGFGPLESKPAFRPVSRLDIRLPRAIAGGRLTTTVEASSCS